MDETFITRLKNGYRMEKPKFTPDSMYAELLCVTVLISHSLYYTVVLYDGCVPLLGDRKSCCNSQEVHFWGPSLTWLNSRKTGPSNTS